MRQRFLFIHSLKPTANALCLALLAAFMCVFNRDPLVLHKPFYRKQPENHQQPFFLS